MFTLDTLLLAIAAVILVKPVMGLYRYFKGPRENA